jgi:hypothetical protein
MLVHESLTLPRHIGCLDRLPTAQRNSIYRALIGLALLKRYGHVVLTVYDKFGHLKRVGEGYNLIMDAGKGELGDLMIGVMTNTINNMNVGTSDASPNDPSLTDLVSAATPVARLAIPSGGRFRTNFLLTFSVLIASNTYTRPFTAKEIAVYFDPNANGKIFARAVITPVTVNSGDTARMDYEIQL